MTQSHTEKHPMRKMDLQICESLLERHTTGRLSYVDGVFPVILPMNYRYSDSHVVMRTRPGAKLTHAPMTGAAFEIDSFDTFGEWGWSVLVRGFVFDITDTVDSGSAFARDLPVWPMPPGEFANWIILADQEVSGRVFGNPPEFGAI